jgi:hypothetical protein
MRRSALRPSLLAFRDPALWAVTIALYGMAYCHVVDLQMKLEEGVQYMAVLFCCNIVASVALVPAFFVAYASRSERLVRAVWAAAVALSAVTIFGFVLSRTVGLPQMDDHVGSWDRLGVTSVAFEGVVLVLGVAVLARVRVAAPSAGVTAAVLAALVIGSLALTAPALAEEMPMPMPMPAGPQMRGDMSAYPQVEKATPRQYAKAKRLWKSARARADLFRPISRALKLGYGFAPRDEMRIGYPGIRHLRKGGNRFWGKLLDPKAPQSLMYWCVTKAQCTLLGYMYRAPAQSKPPVFGPMLMWHMHSNGRSWMTHLWLTGDVRSAFARCAPWPAFTKAFGIAKMPWREDVMEDHACPADGGAMPMPMG